MNSSQKSTKRISRHRRIRAKVKGTSERPRLCVYRSNTSLYAQIIDDDKGVTLASATSKTLKKKGVEAAKVVGTNIAKALKEKGITKVVFDRGGFIYTGQIQALAESARAAGLEF